MLRWIDLAITFRVASVAMTATLTENPPLKSFISIDTTPKFHNFWHKLHDHLTQLRK